MDRLCSTVFNLRGGSVWISVVGLDSYPLPLCSRSLGLLVSYHNGPDPLAIYTYTASSAFFGSITTSQWIRPGSKSAQSVIRFASNGTPGNT